MKENIIEIGRRNDLHKMQMERNNCVPGRIMVKENGVSEMS